MLGYNNNKIKHTYSHTNTKKQEILYLPKTRYKSTINRCNIGGKQSKKKKCLCI